FSAGVRPDRGGLRLRVDRDRALGRLEPAAHRLLSRALCALASGASRAPGEGPLLRDVARLGRGPPAAEPRAISLDAAEASLRSGFPLQPIRSERGWLQRDYDSVVARRRRRVGAAADSPLPARPSAVSAALV